MPAADSGICTAHDGRVRLSRNQADDVLTTEIELPPELAFQVTGQAEFVFSLLLAGTAEFERDGEIDCFVPGEVAISAYPGADFRGWAHGARVRTAVLPVALFDSIVRASPDGPVPAWEFLSRRAVRGGFGRWRQGIRIFEEATGDPVLAASPLIVGRARRLLGLTALATFPNTAGAIQLVGEGHDCHPGTLRRAIAFIEAEPANDIALIDIALASNVTARTVQHAFRRHLETTPMAYLRRVRLDHAHRRLRTVDPTSGITVAQVALDWGFSNPSRFAHYYRDAYGRTPSKTLAE